MIENKQRYVLGFMFNMDKSKVALILKTKPEWQAGLMNGIGGKCENNEPPYFAMVREFKEETGYEQHWGTWHHYCDMIGDKFEVWCYAAYTCNLHELKTTTEEKIIIVEVKDIHTFQYKLLTNVPWLIEMAIDFLNNKQFDMATIRY